MRHGSLFSGIGGFDLAAQWMNWENVFHCEWNPFGQKILNYYWPKAISYEDITKTDFTIYRGRIDIVTGGFPCQPFSHAGKRQGKEDDRYLWPEMLRAIAEIQPTWVVGENVAGIRSMGIEQGYSTLESDEIASQEEKMVIEEIREGLEGIGYELQPFIIPAVAVDAPHRRDRIWFVAYSANARIESLRSQRKNSVFEPTPATNPYGNDGCLLCGHATCNGLETTEQCEYCYTSNYGHASNTSGERLEISRQTGIGEFSTERKKRLDDRSELDSSIIANSNGFGLRGQSNGFGEPRFTNKEGQKYDWSNFPTQPPICDGNDGISAKLDGITFSKWRNESIKGGGNAIVPQLALQIFKTIEQYESDYK